MEEARHFAEVVLMASVAGLAAILANRLTERLKVPAPLLVLVAAAIAAAVVPDFVAPTERQVESIVTVALVAILLDGGMHIGLRRIREAAAPVLVVGVAGTFLTAGAAAVLLHFAFGLAWFPALLVGTAVAPTDPAVVFSVLGRREIAGRSGTILEGESGANDPVGIALMASLLAAGAVSASAFGSVAGEFVLQMAVGGVLGALGGRALLWTMQHVPLPSEALYPLRTLASAYLLYAVATLAHGSGFLAVFVAGIILGDANAPYKREVERVLAALANLGEIVAFVVLGLTIDISGLTRPSVWVPGLVLGLVLALVIRPVFAGLCLLPARLARNELAFVLFAGLKGAVPILLAELVRAAGVPHAERLFGIVVVVVVLSVLLQGGLVPAAARVLSLPVRTRELEPWTLGVRLRDEPSGVHRLRVETGSPADGSSVEALGDLVGDLWVSIVVRGGSLVPIRADTVLSAGDDVVVLAEDEVAPALRDAFTAAAPPAPAARLAGEPRPRTSLRAPRRRH